MGDEQDDVSSAEALASKREQMAQAVRDAAKKQREEADNDAG